MDTADEKHTAAINAALAAAFADTDCTLTRIEVRNLVDETWGTTAVAYELAKYARIEANIDAAVEDGRISAHDGEERKARAEQTTRNRIAYLRSEPRPKQRTRQPLDDPDAGKVG